MPKCKEFRLNITQLFDSTGTLPREQLFEKFDAIKEEFEIQRKKLNLPFEKNEYGLVMHYWNKDDVQLWIYSDAVTSSHILQELSRASCYKFSSRPGGYYDMAVSDVAVEEIFMNKIAEEDAASK